MILLREDRRPDTSRRSETPLSAPSEDFHLPNRTYRERYAGPMKMDVLSKIGFDQQKDPERTAGTTQTFIINTLGFVCPSGRLMPGTPMQPDEPGFYAKWGMILSG